MPAIVLSRSNSLSFKQFRFADCESQTVYYNFSSQSCRRGVIRLPIIKIRTDYRRGLVSSSNLTVRLTMPGHSAGSMLTVTAIKKEEINSKWRDFN